MSQIKFKAKIQETAFISYINLPKIKTIHCDMNAFRVDNRFNANSVIFEEEIKRHLKRLSFKKWSNGQLYIDLADLPPHVTIDTSGFLAVVTIEL